MFQIAQSLSESHFMQMERLEAQFYSLAFITPARESYAYYARFPRSTVAATDDGNIVGFVNLFPVCGRVYHGLLCGTFNDAALTVSDLMDASLTDDSPLHMFLSCIAVARAYRKQGVTHALLRAAVAGYADAAHRCDAVVTDNVTDEGRRFSEKLGFSFVRESDHDSFVYAMPYANFVKSVLSDSLG